jgi:hypothetical protein
MRSLQVMGAMLLCVSMVPAMARAQTDAVASAARLRLVNLVALAPPARGVTLTVDGNVLVSSVGFGASSAYRSVPAGRRHIQIVDTTTGATILDATASLTAGRTYTYQVTGLLDGTLAAQLSTDTTAPLAAGRARVRFGNAIPDDLMVAARLSGGAADFKEVAFGALSPYQDVPAGTYTLDIASPDGQPLLSVPNVTLTPGQVYTLFCTGLNTVSTVPAAAQPGTVVIASALGTQVAGTPPAPSSAPGTVTTTLQLVDLLPDALAGGPVSLSIDDQTAVGALGFGGATNGIPLAIGTHHLQVYRATGGTLLLDTTLTLQKGTGATYLLYRSAGNAVDGLLAQTHTAPIAAATARVRFANASLQGRSLRATLSSATFTAIPLGGVTAYSDLPAGRSTLQISAADGTLLSTMPDTILAGGQTTTLAALDPPGGRGAGVVVSISSGGSQFLTAPAPSNQNQASSSQNQAPS